MRYLRFLLSLALILSPLYMTACSGKEEPKTKINEKEVIEKSTTQAPQAVPAEVPAPESPAPITDTPEAPAPTSTTPDASAPDAATPEAPKQSDTVVAEVMEKDSPAATEAMPEEAKPEEAAPEGPNPDTESLAFYPSIEEGKPLEAVIDAFTAGNYQGLVLVYVGKSDEKIASNKANIHLAHCKSEEVEGILVMSPDATKDRNAIVILGKEGLVNSYTISNVTGLNDIPADFPPLAVNWPEGKNLSELPKDIIQFFNAVQGCGFNI